MFIDISIHYAIRLSLLLEGIGVSLAVQCSHIQNHVSFLKIVFLLCDRSLSIIEVWSWPFEAL